MLYRLYTLRTPFVDVELGNMCSNTPKIVSRCVLIPSDTFIKRMRRRVAGAVVAESTNLHILPEKAHVYFKSVVRIQASSWSK